MDSFEVPEYETRYSFGSGAHEDVDIEVGRANQERSAIGVVRFSARLSMVTFDLFVESRAAGDHDVQLSRIADDGQVRLVARLPPTHDERVKLSPSVVSVAAPEGRVRLQVRGPQSVEHAAVELFVSQLQTPALRRKPLSYALQYRSTTRQLLSAMMRPGDASPVVEARTLAARTGKTLGTITNWGKVALEDLSLEIGDGERQRLRLIAERALALGLLPFTDG